MKYFQKCSDLSLRFIVPGNQNTFNKGAEAQSKPYFLP